MATKGILILHFSYAEHYSLCRVYLMQGCTDPKPLNFVLWSLLYTDHHSGVCSFEVAPRSFENLCTPDLLAVNDVEGVCSVPV
jgi:hypothetical protein